MATDSSNGLHMEHAEDEAHEHEEEMLYDEAEEEEDYEHYEDRADMLEEVFSSVVRVYCTHTEPNYQLPWQKMPQYHSTSSGFVVSLPGDGGHRIITNAHSVEHGSVIQVRRRGMDMKHEAIVEAVGQDCDLAVLRVEGEDSDEFWDGLEPMEFGELPQLQDEVAVLGYPIGGETMSVTEGVVSRIEMQEYAQAGRSLLALQIDAAINSGNSGGPVVNDELEVVGVAFQAYDSNEADNIGYVVPVAVVLHFLEQIRRFGHYTGFCDIGIRYQPLENAALRRFLGMTSKQSGILVRDVAPTSNASSFLRSQDVILAVDDITIANDGTIPFEKTGERVGLNYYMSSCFLGDSVRIDLLRDKELHTLDVPVSCARSLLPKYFSSRTPPYIVVAGMVFTVLSIPLLESEIDNDASWQLPGVNHFIELASYGRRMSPTQEVVVLAHVLAHRANLGFDDFCHLELSKFNGFEIQSLAQLAKLLTNNTEPYLRFDFRPGAEVVVIEASAAAESTIEVCRENCVPASMSPGLQEVVDRMKAQAEAKANATVEEAS